MMTNAQIRAFARNQLRGNWGAVIGAGFLILFSMFAYFVVLYAVVVLGSFSPLFGRSTVWSLRMDPAVPLAIQALLGIVIAALLFLGLWIYAGLSLGMQQMYFAVARGRRVRVTDVFHGFRNLQHMTHFFGTLLVIWFIQIVLEIPQIMIGHHYGTGTFDYCVTQTITSFIVYVIGLYLSMAALASADHPSMRTWTALRTSLHMMRNKKMKLLGLYLSFFGWVLLMVFTLGLAGIFVQPYLSQAVTIFYLSAYSDDYPSGVEEAEYREVDEADYREVKEPADQATQDTDVHTSDENPASRSFDDVRREYTQESVGTDTDTEGENL